MKPVDPDAFNKRIIVGSSEQAPLPLELIRFIQALARMAAKEDYEYFCRTGRVLSYDGTEE